MENKLTDFQQELWNAARWMTETITVSGIAMKEARNKFRALVERAYDKNDLKEQNEQTYNTPRY